MRKKDAGKDISGFDNFAALVKKSMSIVQRNCPVHGITKHSYCSLSGVAICLECIKARRFMPQKESVRRRCD